MSDQGLQPRSVRRVLQVLSLVVFGPVALALVAACFVYPSWQLAVAATCMLGMLPVLYLGAGSRTRIGPGGASARQHLASSGWALLAVALFVVAGVMLSLAPID